MAVSVACQRVHAFIMWPAGPDQLLTWHTTSCQFANPSRGWWKPCTQKLPFGYNKVWFVSHNGSMEKVGLLLFEVLVILDGVFAGLWGNALQCLLKVSLLHRTAFQALTKSAQCSFLAQGHHLGHIAQRKKQQTVNLWLKIAHAHTSAPEKPSVLITSCSWSNSLPTGTFLNCICTQNIELALFKPWDNITHSYTFSPSDPP